MQTVDKRIWPCVHCCSWSVAVFLNWLPFVLPARPGATSGLLRVVSAIPDIKVLGGQVWITTRECKDVASSASRLLTVGGSIFAMMFSRAAPLAVSLFLASMMSGFMADEHLDTSLPGCSEA
eukprot:2928070-Rhodomonas_salina.5